MLIPFVKSRILEQSGNLHDFITRRSLSQQLIQQFFRLAAAILKSSLSKNALEHLFKRLGIQPTSQYRTIRSHKEHTRSLKHSIFTLEIRIKFRIPQMHHLLGCKPEILLYILLPLLSIVSDVKSIEANRIILICQSFRQSSCLYPASDTIRIVEIQHRITS